LPSLKTLGLSIAVVALGLAPAAGAAVIKLGTSANAKTLHVHVGDRLVLTLPANSSTGYSWSIVQSGAPALHLVSASYMDGRPGVPGAPGSYVARFTVRSAGRGKLSLTYVRHTHPATPPAARFAVSIVAT
jgi:inhibitor of cysteine peptidase